MTFNFLKNDLIIITSNNIKSKIIKYCVENKKLFNIKFFTLNEFINNLHFSYNEETIVRVMDEFNLEFLVAKNYLNNLKYLLDENKDDKRIYLLEKIKFFCEENKLLLVNKNFKHLIKNKEIIILGYDYIATVNKKIFELNNILYREINLREENNITDVIFEFKTRNDEIHYVANKILSLVEKGIDINKIFISFVNDNYNYLIKKIFKQYDLPVNIRSTSSLYETMVGKYFLDNLTDNISIDIDNLKTRFPSSLDLINKVIDVLNKYSFVSDWKSYKNVLIEEFKSVKLDEPIFSNAINIIDLEDNIIGDDEYVFLVGFNLNQIPRIYKNEDYISDEIKFSFMEKTNDKNKIEKKKWKNIILSTKNIVISYSLGYLNEALYPSNLVSELNCKILKKEREISLYSEEANKNLLSEKLDKYFKFGIIDQTLKDLICSYNYEYNSFDNNYKGVNNFSENVVLSYSSMNNFYKCAFRYYLANVLKIDIYNENFSQYIGNLFHYCLQHYYAGNKNIDELYDKYILENNYHKSEKEKFFIEQLRDELHFIIKTIDSHNELSEYNDFKLEEKFVMNNNNDIFKGFIDKIMYKDNKVAIIDYKTGNIEMDLALVPYGLSLQLPVYLYLAKMNNCNNKIVGFYLQHILNPKMRYVKGKRYESLKKNALRLQGYSLGNESLLSEFDSSYQDSEVIKGMKLSNNGFYHYSKVLTEHQMDILFNVVDMKIKEAFNEIKQANFIINPKVIKGNVVGCDFCKFKDICFRDEHNKVYLNVDEDASYLGGESNAELD